MHDPTESGVRGIHMGGSVPLPVIALIASGLILLVVLRTEWATNLGST